MVESRVDGTNLEAGLRPQSSAKAVADRLPLTKKTSRQDLRAVLTIHHWTDRAVGLTELRRVARRRIVVFTWLPERFATFWLNNYLPRIDASPTVSVESIAEWLPSTRITVTPVPIPHDCTDGFAGAHWRRPHAYLDAEVRAGISSFAMADAAALQPGLDLLSRDLTTGKWYSDNAHLLHLEVLDLGYVITTVQW